MPFKTTLRAEIVPGKSEGGRQIWKMTAPLVYERPDLDQIFIVPEGFETDYASVPRLPFAYWLTGDTAHPPAVVHDWLYVTKTVDRETADRVFLEAMEEWGVSWWRRRLMYSAVRMFGGAVRNKNQSEQIEGIGP